MGTTTALPVTHSSLRPTAARTTTAMSSTSVIFSATGQIQTFIAPATGSYVIEASGAQGGAGGGPGGKGARVRGTFQLEAGESLKIVVGRQGTAGTTPHQPAGGGGGGSFVWKGTAAWPLPDKPLLAAGGGGGGGGGDGVVTLDGGRGAVPGGRNGRGGASDAGNFRYSGGGGTGWRSGGEVGSTPTLCFGGSQWQGGTGADYCCNQGGSGGFGGGGGGSFLGHGSGGGGGFSGGGGGTQAGPDAGGGGSFNAGKNQTNLPGIQIGDGCVTITPVPEPNAIFRPRTSSLASANPFPSEPSIEPTRPTAVDLQFAGFR